MYTNVSIYVSNTANDANIRAEPTEIFLFIAKYYLRIILFLLYYILNFNILCQQNSFNQFLASLLAEGGVARRRRVFFKPDAALILKHPSLASLRATLFTKEGFLRGFFTLFYDF